jgi:DNA-directed RNA polymerase beta subunit
MFKIQDEDMCFLKIMSIIVKDPDYFTKPLTESYNSAIINIINIIKLGFTINLQNNVTYTLKVEDVKITYPYINNTLITLPLALGSNDLSYYFTVNCKFTQIITINTNSYVVKDETLIPYINIPIMVGSNYCLGKKKDMIYDPLLDENTTGGYFVLKGNKRGISFRYKLKYNEPLIIPYTKILNKKLNINNIYCLIYSKKAFEYPSLSYNIEIKYKNDILILIIILKDVKLSFNIFSIILKLNSMTHKEIINEIATDVLENCSNDIYNICYKSLNDKHDITDEQIVQIKTTFIHIEPTNLVDYLFYTIKKILRVHFGFEEIIERDSYSKAKSIDSPGSLIEELSINHKRNVKNNFTKYIEKSNIKELNNIAIFKVPNIFHTEYLLSNFISSGSWGNSIKKVGVCQLILPLNYVNQLQLLRKFTSEKISDDSQSLIDKRIADSEIQGFICTATSPASKNVGYHRYLATFAQVTTYNYEYHFTALKYIKEYLKENVDNYLENKNYYLLLDGEILGKKLSLQYIQEIATWIDNLRYTTEDYVITNCHYINYKSFSLIIQTIGGRLIVPVIKLNFDSTIHKLPVTYDEMKNINTFEDLKKYRIIDYIDIQSIQYKSVGLNMDEIHNYQRSIKSRYNNNTISYKFNYCHIDTCALYSLSLALSILPNCNAGVRNLHEAKQMASSIGSKIYLNYVSNLKTDKVLASGTKSLVNTDATKYLLNDVVTDKFNVFVQINSRSENQEDAICASEHLKKRGGLLMKVFKTYIKEVDLKINEKLASPINVENDRINYSKINNSGVVNINEIVYKNDCIIYKLINLKDTISKMRPDIEIYDSDIPGHVVYVNISTTMGKQTVVIKIEQLLTGFSGDKFASVHGQKGVLGAFLHPTEFGSNEYGFRASFQLSPAAYTRMTNSQLLTPLLNQVAIINCNNIIVNQKSKININKLRDYIESNGVNKYLLFKHYIDKHNVYYMNNICTSVIGFRRLKEIVDVSHVKELKGEINHLTKNPTDGKSGGSKIGKMEIDALLSHGVSSLIKNTYKFVHYSLCNNCGIIAINNYCKTCESSSSIIKVSSVGAFKTITDIFMSLGISLKCHVANENIII